MPKAEEIMELARRCEEAKGPDESLDVEIVYALHPDIGPYQGQCIGDEPIFWHEPYRKQPCPKFTASLDSAMTLVPEGVGRERLTLRIERKYDGRSCALLLDSLTGDEAFSEAATPALALAAAALKSIAMKGKGNE